MEVAPVYLVEPPPLPPSGRHVSRRGTLMALAAAFGIGAATGVSLTWLASAEELPEPSPGDDPWLEWLRATAAEDDETFLSHWEAIAQVAHLHAGDEPLIWDTVQRLAHLAIEGAPDLLDAATRSRIAVRLSALLDANDPPAALHRHRLALRALAR
jgi:hypothetical protein